MKVRPRSYSVVAPPPAPELSQPYLIYYRQGAQVFAVSFDAAGAAVEEVGERITSETFGRAIYPAAGDGLAPGCRIGLDGSDLITMDFLGGASYRYTPPSGWTAGAPQQIAPGGPIYWIEFEAGLATDTIEARLRSSASAKWSSPTTVRTMTVDGSPLTAGTWGTVLARGPEFTESVASLWIDRTDESNFWYRVVLALDGSFDDQRAGQEFDPQLKRRAGSPLTAAAGLIDASTSVSEQTAALCYKWDGNVDANPQTDYSVWPPSGAKFIGDLAPDPSGTGVWMLASVVSPGIFHFSDAGDAISSVETNWFLSPIPGTSITHDFGAGLFVAP